MVDWNDETQKAKYAACVTGVQAGDSSAAEALIVAMEPAILSLAKRYGDPRRSEFDDRLQVGRLAVYEAALNYDPSKGTSVSTHCYNMIRYRLLRDFREHSRDRVFNGAISLDVELGGDGFSLGPTIPDHKSIQPEDAVTLAHDYGLAEYQLRRISNRKTRYVVFRKLRGDTYVDIAVDLGVSRAAVQARGKDGLRILDQTPLLPSYSYSSWTCLQLDTLRQCTRGVSYHKIAQKLNRSAVACRSEAARVGLRQFKHLNRTDRARLLDLHDSGMTAKDVSSRLGCSTETVRVIVKRNGRATNAYTEQWNNNPVRLEAIRQSAAKRVETHRQQTASLGWLVKNHRDAVLLSALDHIGSGDREAIAKASRVLCVSKNLRPACTSWRSVLQCMPRLLKTQMVKVVSGAGNRRRVYALGLSARPVFDKGHHATRKTHHP